MPDPYAGIADPYAAVAEPVAAPPAADGGTVPLVDPVTGQAVTPLGKPPTPEEAAKLYAFAQRARSPQELEQYALSLRPDRSLAINNAKDVLHFRDKNGGVVSHSINWDGGTVASPETWGEWGSRQAGRLVSDVAGVGEGLASVADTPARILGWLLGHGGDVVGVPEHITNALKHPTTIGGLIETGLPVPDDPAGRYTREMARGAGGALAGGPGVGAVLARSANPVTRGVGALLRENPGMQVAAGASGGAAAEGVKDAGGGPLLQTGAALLVGGGLPAAGAGVGGALDSLLGRTLGLKPHMEDAGAAYIRAHLTQPVDEAVTRIGAAEPQVSGADPTLAEVTLDPGIAAMQRGIGNVSPTAGARISRRVNANSQKRIDTIDATLGEGDPAAIPAAAAARVAELNAAAAGAVDKVGKLAPPDVAGARAREALSTGYRGAKARTADAYGHPILQEDPPVRLRPFDPEDVTLAQGQPRSDLAAFQDEAVRVSRSALPPQPRTMLQFVRAHGGIAADDPLSGDFHAEGMGSNGQPTLINRNGRTLDNLRELAVEAHYIPEDASLADFTHMLVGEYRGSQSPRFSSADESDMLARQEAERARDWWRQEFDKRGLDPTKMSTEDWTRFYDDVNGKSSSAPQTIEDLRATSGPGHAAGPFQQTLMSIRNHFFGDGGTEASAPVRNFFDEVLGADEVGLKTLGGWERRARDLAAGVTDRTQAASLRAVAEAIGAKAAMESDPGRRAALEAARGVRREQGQVFEQGPVGAALGKERYGDFTVPDSRVGAVLVPPGRVGGEAVDQLSKAAGPAAEDIVRTEVRAALDTAGSDPRAIGRVAAKYTEAVSRFPELGQAVAEARQNAALAARFRSTKLGSFLADGADPTSAVGRLLTVQDGGRAFKSLVTADGMNGHAMAGVRRAVAEHIRAVTATAQLDESLTKVPSPRKMGDLVAALLDRTSGTGALTEGQRKVLSSVGRELDSDQFARSANRTSGSDSVRNLGLTMRLAEYATHGIPTGGGKSILRILLSLSPQADRTMDVVARAIEDPRFAAQLLARPTKPRLAQAAAYMRAFGIGGAMGAVPVAGDRNDRWALPAPGMAGKDPYSDFADPYGDAAEVVPEPTGQRVAGNIDIHARPVVHNADGTISTVRSMSFGTDQGDVLIPTVADDGRMLSEQEAIDLYRRTGRHLGIFDSPGAATAYAKSLHEQQSQEYAGG